MKTVTIIKGSDRSGKSLLADRLAKSIADKPEVYKGALNRPNMVRLHKMGDAVAVALFEMVPGYEIEQVLRDVDFFKLLEKSHVIITTYDNITTEDLQVEGHPSHPFVIQILLTEVIFPK